ncbi:MAG: lipopolysaccharide kinase InaA family protein, partial [Gemmatimonadaceae bacterium]
MTASPYAAPAGYEALTVLHGHSIVRVVAQQPLAATVRTAMDAMTLHEFAARTPGARALAGRGTAWAATLPDGTAIVVRHTRHGGLLAPFTRDLFLAPTRAPHELHVALRLTNAGVPTPVIAAYAIYPAIGPFVRSDVATHRLDGEVFPDALRLAADGRRGALLGAIARLLHALRRAGAHHPDLNVRNVFITGEFGAPVAAVLDVDRVTFGERGDARLAAMNLGRLLRSCTKAGLGLT